MSIMSKESPKLSLNVLLAGAAAATVIGLSGCAPQAEEPKVEAGSYRTVADCMADGHASNLCSSAMASAKAEAAKVTPTYERKEDCEEDWGSSNCGPAATAQAEPELGSIDAPSGTTAAAGSTHTTSFVPYYWGYMMGSHNGSYYSQPLYRGAGDTPRLASGYQIPAGKSMVPASAFNKAGASHFAAGKSQAVATKAAAANVSAKGFGSVGRAGGVSAGG